MLLLSPRNTQLLPDMATAVTETTPSGLHLGRITQIFPQCDVVMCGRGLEINCFYSAMQTRTIRYRFSNRP